MRMLLGNIPAERVPRYEQLELALFPREPWNGVLPRGLTRGFNYVIFKARAEGDSGRTFVDRDQLELPLGDRKNRPRSSGRPSVTLLPLPWE